MHRRSLLGLRDLIESLLAEAGTRRESEDTSRASCFALTAPGPTNCCIIFDLSDSPYSLTLGSFPVPLHAEIVSSVLIDRGDNYSILTHGIPVYGDVGRSIRAAISQGSSRHG